MIWALAGVGAGLLCLCGGLLFWALRRALRQGAADAAARFAGLEAQLNAMADAPAPLGPEALADLSTGLKDDLAIMFTYAGRLAAISREESDRVIACINALHGIETPTPRAAPSAPQMPAEIEAPQEEDASPPPADDSTPGLDAMALEDLDDADAPADAAETDEPAFDVDNLGVPAWATEGEDAAAPADAAETDEPAFDVDNLGVPAWATEGEDDAAPADAAETDEPAFDVDNLGVPAWATEGEDDAAPADAAETDEPAFDVDNLGVPDWATEDAADADQTADDIEEEADAAPSQDAPPQGDGASAPPSADMGGLAAQLLAAQQDAADRIEARLASVAAGIMALSSSSDTSERLDAIAASGDTRIALLSALSRDVGAGLASLDAGQEALREALERLGAGGGDADVARIADALSGLQARTETLSHAVDAAAGAVDEAAEAAAAAVLSAAQDRASQDEARLQALCDRIAGLAGGHDAPSGDALGALSAQVDGLQARVAEMAALAAIHRDALARVEDAVAPDRLRLLLDGAAERSETAVVRRAASRIVDMPALDPAPRPPKTAARD